MFSLSRNATPNARVPDALRRTGHLSARTKSLALRLVPLNISNSYSGMNLIPQVQGMSSHKRAGSSGKRSQIYLPKNPWLPSLNSCAKQLRPLVRLSIPPVTIVHCPGMHYQIIGHRRLTKPRHGTIPALYFHRSLCCRLSYPPGFHPGPMPHYRCSELSRFSFPVQPWGSWI